MKNLKLANLYLLIVLLVLGLVSTACDTTVTADVLRAGPRNLSSAPPEEAGMSTERLERVSAAMQNLVDEGKLAGITTMVARHGKIVHFGTFGYQDIASETPMAEDTIFRIYSMSKPITGVALMMLYEEGKFRLADPVAYLEAQAGRLVILDEIHRTPDLFAVLRGIVDRRRRIVQIEYEQRLISVEDIFAIGDTEANDVGTGKVRVRCIEQHGHGCVDRDGPVLGRGRAAVYQIQIKWIIGDVGDANGIIGRVLFRLKRNVYDSESRIDIDDCIDEFHGAKAGAGTRADSAIKSDVSRPVEP